MKNKTIMDYILSEKFNFIWDTLFIVAALCLGLLIFLLAWAWLK